MELLRFFNKIGVRESDAGELVLQKNFMIYLGCAMSMGGLIWGTICFSLDLYLQGLIPYGYALLTITNFVIFHYSKKFEHARFFQVLISLLLPFVFQFVMGGFVASGGAMLWAIISLIAALTFVSFRSVLYWWVVFVLLTVCMGLLDGVTVKAYPPSSGLSSFFFVINFAIISSIVFGLSYYFALNRSKATARIEAAKNQAETASRIKSEFLANMSHEIRTPLNGVIGFSELMSKTRLNETQQQYMAMVSQSGNLLLDIINDILDFSKIESGKLYLNIEKIDLPEVSGQVADMIKFQAHKKGLELLLNISPAVPRFIWADEIRLRQILMNLLSNAVKFTESGEIELKVEALETRPGDATRFRFSVRDTGIGVDWKNQEKIFKAFSQEDGSTTKRFGGTGLGLTISDKLLALMGSKLLLLSKPGKGSTFYFDLVLKSQSGSLLEAVDLPHIHKALIVDDNANNRFILKDMLALKGIASEPAASGQEALDKINKGNDFDVVIMDYHMPGMDGLETIAKIRAKFSGTSEPPAILLYSSSNDTGIKETCAALQVQQRLVKPAKMNQLFRALAALKTMTPLPAVAVTAPEVLPAADFGAGTVKVLIAEDNNINMLLCKTLVKKILPGAVFYESVNGAQAVHAFKEVQPDIVFMDVQMPEMNGYDATAAIRSWETDTRVPIIALTAGTVKGERERCIAAGMDDYLSKPIARNVLEQIIQDWWTGQRQN